MTGAVTFNQIFSAGDAGELWVNGQIGSNAALSTFATVANSDALGNLVINVNAPSSPGVDIAGLAIEQGTVIPEPTTLLIWSLLAGLGVSLGWRRRR